MVSQLAVAGSVEDQEFGLVAETGVVFGAEAVFEGIVVGGKLAEGCLRGLAGVGYGGLAIGERSQQCRLSSTAGSKEKDSGKLFGRRFSVEEVVEEDGRGQADE